jgi:hypothetical protein
MKQLFQTLLIVFYSTQVYSQKRDIPLTLSLFNESTAIPYTKFITTPIHPGIQIGTEINYKDKVYARLFQTCNISYFYHQYLTQGIGVNTELGGEYRFRFGLGIESLIGVGYMHTFATTEEFVFSNGQYEKKVDKGNPRFYPSFSLGIGYYFKKDKKNSPKLYFRYQSWAEYPYSPDFIPVMTHINFHVGVKFFLGNKKTND